MGLSYFDKVSYNIKDGFKIAKESSFGKGTISAVKDITGYDINNIDGSNPDGVNAGSKKSGNVIKSAVPVNDFKTFERAKMQDQPFTMVDGTGVSKYYTEVVQAEQYRAKLPNGKDGNMLSIGMRPYSIFNKYSLVNYRGTPLDISTVGSNENGFSNTSRYRKIDPNNLINPTVTEIIEITSAVPDNYGYRYQYSDFALAKYYGKIPNNLLITLRRFSFPAGDDIITPKGMGPGGKMVPIQQPDIARAVTWLGEAPGNNITDILKFSHGFNWKEATSEVQVASTKTSGSGGVFGNIVDNNRFLSAAANAGAGRDAVASSARKQNANYDSFSETYPNHVFGPLNVIKQVLVREQGLKFEQEFKLKFEYQLRAFEGANPKVMMLDQLANILALTYNNAPFWGGSVRYISDGSVAKPLGDLEKLQAGDYMGFAGSIISDMGKMFKGTLTGIEDLMNGDFKSLKSNKFLNNLIGGMGMELFNTPQGGQAIQSLLTGDPTGQWHVTIGNPLNPIAVIGNLICEKTEVKFTGPLGPLDFPENLEISITLKPGRPRDKSEIESMFNSGKGRFYITPKGGPDINKEKIAGTAKGDGTHTSAPNLYASKSSIQMTEAEFDEYKKLANG